MLIPTPKDRDALRVIGIRIAEARDRAGLTQTELAGKLGVTRVAVAKWEGGKAEPSSGNMHRLAAVLDVSVEFLQTGEGNPSSGQLGGGSALLKPDGELLDLANVPPALAGMFTPIKDRANCEVWRVTSDVLVASGVFPGDYVVVDLDAKPRARDLVLALVGDIPIFRMWLPPYLYPTPLSSPPPVLVVGVRTVVRGLIISKHSL